LVLWDILRICLDEKICSKCWKWRRNWRTYDASSSWRPSRSAYGILLRYNTIQ